MNATVRFETCPPEPVRFHEYANLFPMILGDALDALREDIRQNGVREPVVFLDGAILDGRNRYQCARDLGLSYPRRDFEGDDALAFVVSVNLHRRHLGESQRANIAARIANMEHGGNRREQAADLPLKPAAPPPVTQASAAKMLNVSPRIVREAKRVQETAPPEIVQAIDDGRISVSLASQVAELPEEVQAEVIAAAPEETRAVAREAVKRKPIVLQNTGKTEWYTPTKILDAARAVLGGFDLDPASSPEANQNVGAAHIFTADDNGLEQEWPRGRIWMNPPYAANLVGKFIERFCVEVGAGSTGCVLVNNATETGWFQDLLRATDAVCFPSGRLRFIDPEKGDGGAPLQGQAIFYAGPNPDFFAAEFSRFGHVLQVMRNA